MYQIPRIFFKGEVEGHSIEERATYREALTRFHAIIAADVGNNDVTYSYSTILDEEGHDIVAPFVFNPSADIEGEGTVPFLKAVLRVRVKNGQRSTSVEYLDHANAIKRFFAILAADLQDEEVTYNMACVLTPSGHIDEARAFIRREEENQ